MAITDYTSLKSEVATWLARSDQTSNIDTFIDNAEAWMNRELRTRNQEASSTSLTISASGVVSHPADWLAWKEIKITTAPVTHIEVATEESADLNYETGTTGRPIRAIVRGDTTILKPVPDVSTYAYEFVYYQKIPALTGSATTNWVLLNHSDLYLYGSLWQGALLLQDPNAAHWAGLALPILNSLKKMSNLDGRSGGSLRPRVRRVV